jgi:hypothetical protein
MPQRESERCGILLSTLMEERHDALDPRPRQQLPVTCARQHRRHCHRPRFSLDLHRHLIRPRGWRRLTLQTPWLPLEREGRLFFTGPL